VKEKSPSQNSKHAWSHNDQYQRCEYPIIKLVTPPYFLATKIEAFKGRGKGDYMASHDMEDIITVLDGRREIIDEIISSSDELKTFLSTTFRIFLDDENFFDAIPGQLLPDRASQARLPRLIKLLEEIANM
jgi:hypothetical protein